MRRDILLLAFGLVAGMLVGVLLGAAAEIQRRHPARCCCCCGGSGAGPAPAGEVNLDTRGNTGGGGGGYFGQSYQPVYGHVTIKPTPKTEPK